ncbi:MAG: hypothetical protein ACLU9X_10715 [Alistipes shahii]
MTAFQTYIVEYAKKQGISLQLAMASMLKSGTQSLQMTGLTPELSYVIFAFGMDLQGQHHLEPSSTQFKTTADGYSAGPNYGGSDWFTQRFYITNAYLALTGYGWTNSVWTHWKGDDVTGRPLPYADDQALQSGLLRSLRPTGHRRIPERPQLRSPVQPRAALGDGKQRRRLQRTYGRSQRRHVLHAAHAGHLVERRRNGLRQLRHHEDQHGSQPRRFAAAASTNANYGPTHNTVAGVMKGIDIATAALRDFQTERPGERQHGQLSGRDRRVRTRPQGGVPPLHQRKRLCHPLHRGAAA